MGLDPAVECYRRLGCLEEMVEVVTRVLIAGGGVAALEAALALRELGEGRVGVEISRRSLSFGTGRSPSPSRSVSAR